MGISLRSFGVRFHFVFELFLPLSLKLLSALIELLFKLLLGFLLDLSAGFASGLSRCFYAVIGDLRELRFRVLGGRIVLIAVDIRY